MVAQLKQAEARRARLEQRCRFEGGPGGSADDPSLLHHWVEELDEFREGEMAFMDRMRCWQRALLVGCERRERERER